MIICICNRINDHAVRKAAARGAHSPCAVYAAHGCSMKCGRCVPAMNDILSDSARMKREAVAVGADHASLLAAE